MITVPYKWNNATDASEWCVDNLKDEDWSMEILQLFPTKYSFKFHTKEAATLFSLRWAESA